MLISRECEHDDEWTCGGCRHDSISPKRLPSERFDENGNQYYFGIWGGMKIFKGLDEVGEIFQGYWNTDGEYTVNK